MSTVAEPPPSPAVPSPAVPPPVGPAARPEPAGLRVPAPRAGGRAAPLPVDPEALVGVLREHYDLGPCTSWRRAERGMSNASLFVTTADGPVVLRRSHEGKTPAAAAFEAGVLAHLVERGYPAPPVVETRGGEPFAVVDGLVHLVTRLLPGDHPAGRPSAEQARSVARGLARYHSLVAGLPLRGAPSRSATLDALADPVPRLLEEAAGPACRHLAADAAAALGTALRGLAEQAAAVRGALLARRDALTSLVVHGSYGRSAVLLAGDELTGVLDYDRATLDLLDVDLVYALKSFCRPAAGRGEPGPDPDLARAFLAAYCQERPLAAADVEALPLVTAALRLAKVGRKCANLLARAERTPDLTAAAERFAGTVATEVARGRWADEHPLDLAVRAQ